MAKIGNFLHFDLTVGPATEVADFYAKVVGWGIQPVNMGEYEDYVMTEPDSGEGRAGVCHARGSNANIPPQWLLYVNVAQLDESLQTCKELGGKVIGAIRDYGEHGRYCLIQDPAGAYMMLYQEAA